VCIGVCLSVSWCAVCRSLWATKTAEASRKVRATVNRKWNVDLIKKVVPQDFLKIAEKFFLSC